MPPKSDENESDSVSALKSGHVSLFRKIIVFVIWAVTTLMASAFVKYFLVPFVTKAGFWISLSSGVVTICESKTAKSNDCLRSICRRVLPSSQSSESSTQETESGQASLAKDKILGALSHWRQSGVKANTQDLELLQGIKESDKLVPVAGVWDEIKAAQDVLNASTLRLSVATLSRLPMYVKSEELTDRALTLRKRVIERLRAARFKMSDDEQHAAVIFDLAEAKTSSSSDSSKLNLEYTAHATLRAYAFYNIDNEPFHDFFESGVYGPATMPDYEQRCALLDAGFNVADKFIETVGLKRQPYRPSC